MMIQKKIIAAAQPAMIEGESVSEIRSGYMRKLDSSPTHSRNKLGVLGIEFGKTWTAIKDLLPFCSEGGKQAHYLRIFFPILQSYLNFLGGHTSAAEFKQKISDYTSLFTGDSVFTADESALLVSKLKSLLKEKFNKYLITQLRGIFDRTTVQGSDGRRTILDVAPDVVDDFKWLISVSVVKICDAIEKPTAKRPKGNPRPAGNRLTNATFLGTDPSGPNISGIFGTPGRAPHLLSSRSYPGSYGAPPSSARSRTSYWQRPEDGAPLRFKLSKYTLEENTRLNDLDAGFLQLERLIQVGTPHPSLRNETGTICYLNAALHCLAEPYFIRALGSDKTILKMLELSQRGDVDSYVDALILFRRILAYLLTANEEFISESPLCMELAESRSSGSGDKKIPIDVIVGVAKSKVLRYVFPHAGQQDSAELMGKILQTFCPCGNSCVGGTEVHSTTELLPAGEKPVRKQDSLYYEIVLLSTEEQVTGLQVSNLFAQYLTRDTIVPDGRNPREIRRVTSFDSAPQYLPVRFSKGDIRPPMDIVDGSMQIYIPLSNVQVANYSLYAIQIHSGGARGGHYWSMVNIRTHQDPVWNYLNDGVSKTFRDLTPYKEIINSSAAVLVYVRTDHPTSSVPRSSLPDGSGSLRQDIEPLPARRKMIPPPPPESDPPPLLDSGPQVLSIMADGGSGTSGNFGTVYPATVTFQDTLETRTRLSSLGIVFNDSNRELVVGRPQLVVKQAKLGPDATQETIAKAQIQILNEFTLARDLTHASLVPVLAMNTTPAGVHQLVMVNAGTGLNSIFVGLGPSVVSLKEKAAELAVAFPIKRRIDAWFSAVQAVAYLHSQGIVHGDVHLGNLMIDDNDRIRLGDFGLSVKASEFKYKRNYHPDIKPPEVQSSVYQGLSDLAEAGYAIDMFALGTLFISMLLYGEGSENLGSVRAIPWIVGRGSEGGLDSYFINYSETMGGPGNWEEDPSALAHKLDEILQPAGLNPALSRLIYNLINPHPEKRMKVSALIAELKRLSLIGVSEA